MARPTKYKEEFNKLAYQLCELGATDKKLADNFNVSVRTINDWKKTYPRFLHSIKDGKAIFDNEVERSLFQRATGYTTKETRENHSSGDIVETTKKLPPETKACIFWLRNRKPKEWRESHSAEIEDRTITINIVREADQ